MSIFEESRKKSMERNEKMKMCVREKVNIDGSKYIKR